ncbi:interleukin-20 receptor subunit beta isoform X3 [Rattus norvegicus]|uniref:interleukin-20 receptor subunit beta isoform X3 n=1 Tax=Rattus norvegicus TaxID=10116 RepID=UPI002FD8438F
MEMSQDPRLSFLWNSDRPLPLMQYLGLGKKEGAVKSAHFEHLGQLSFSERVKLHCNSDLSTSICFLKQDGQHGQKASFWKKTVFQGKLSLPEFLTKQASTMVFQGVWTSPIMWFFYSMTSGFLTDGATILPAPQNFSVRSTNMKHLLMWNPVTQPGETVFYFVQYQGEYESLYMSHIWIPSSQCSPTKGLECDVTDDVTATVPYNFRVMAMLGSQSSAWSNLEHPFNRNATVLTPPRMEVTEHGLHLVVELEDLGPQFEFLVVYWRMEPGAVERVKVVRSGDIPVHLETMDPGVMYCVKAQALVKTIGRHSAFSQPTCVEMQESNQLIPEADPLQKGGGGCLCRDRAVLGASLWGLDLADLRST